MADRELVGFDMTREDIPLRHGRDWTRETPYSPEMAHQDLRVTAARHPGRFQQVLALACQMMERANPGTVAAVINEEYDGDEMVACTVTPVAERQA